MSIPFCIKRKEHNTDRQSRKRAEILHKYRERQIAESVAKQEQEYYTLDVWERVEGTLQFRLVNMRFKRI